MFLLHFTVVALITSLQDHTCAAPIVDTKVCQRTLEFPPGGARRALFMQNPAALKLLRDFFFGGGGSLPKCPKIPGGFSCSIRAVGSG